MRIDVLRTGSLAAGATASFKVNKGHLNGLLVFGVEEDPKTVVTIKRSTPSRTHVLAANIPLIDFRLISDLEHGYGIGVGGHIQALVPFLETAATITAANWETIEQTYGELGLYAYYVDLGSLYLSGESELEVTIQKAATSAAGEFRVYSASLMMTPDVMYQYDASADPDQVHYSVDAIYLTHNGAGMIRLDDATQAFTLSDGVTDYSDSTIQVEDDENTYLSDVIGAYGAALVLGHAHAAIAQRVFLVYRRPDGVPQTVNLKVRGFDLASGKDKVVVRRIVADEQTTSKNTVAQGEKYLRRLQKFERRDPEQAKALRHAGVIDKSADVGVALSQAKV